MDKIETLQEVEVKLFLQPLVDLIAKLSYFRRLERVWQLIENNYADTSLTLERVASVTGINKNRLNILLRRTTGFTFLQLLNRYRLLKAISMMMAKNYSLLEIALQNGFNNPTTFERNFHSYIGTTPRDFKKDKFLLNK